MTKGKSTKPRSTSSAAADAFAPRLNADFREWAGFSATRAKLTDLARGQRLPPVLLLEGREGIGKRLAAAFVAGLWLCETHSACGGCASCLSVIKGDHPEVIWFDGAGEPLKVQDVDTLQEHVALSPYGHSGGFRLAVVIDADQMTEQAANRLLKTLEEPQPLARIVMTTSRFHALLPTIRSRLVRWHLAPPPLDVGREIILNELASTASAAPPGDELDEILRRAGLSPGKALLHLTSGHEERAKREDMVNRLIREDDPAVTLSLAEELTRGFGITAADLALDAEIVLNRLYRRIFPQRLDLASETNVEQSKEDKAQSAHDLWGAWCESAEVRARRDILRRLRHLATFGKIRLNAQLSAESMGLGMESR